MVIFLLNKIPFNFSPFINQKRATVNAEQLHLTIPYKK